MRLAGGEGAGARARPELAQRALLTAPSRPAPAAGRRQDAATAKKLAFSREVERRCVTLEGDDFNPKGLLTGGARQQVWRRRRKRGRGRERQRRIERPSAPGPRVPPRVCVRSPAAASPGHTGDHCLCAQGGCVLARLTELLAAEERLAAAQAALAETEARLGATAAAGKEFKK